MKAFMRKLFRIGGGRSLALIIPAEIADELRLQVHQKLSIHRRGKEIIIRDWKG